MDWFQNLGFFQAEDGIRDIGVTGVQTCALPIFERLFLMSADSALFASLPRAGKRLAPRLLAEIGDERTRYADAGGLQALAGTAPVCFESGNYAKAHRRYACLKPLRNAMHHFAWQSTLREPWALAYYQRKRQEGKSHTVAIRTLANVWLR